MKKENSYKIYLFNTLGKEKQEFTPITAGIVKMYHCGPTVYDYPHIGNLRAYVFADTLRRVFEYNNYKVEQVINVTDIGHLSDDGDSGEDKMTKALKRENKPLTLESMREVANFYYNSFIQSSKELNIESATYYPFASDHIQEDIEMIEQLLIKDIAYKTSRGIYFDTSKKSDYGKLGQTEGDESRIGEDSEKRNHKDFAVWKFDEKIGYEAPFGKGFPGWHIECSAMSRKYLGKTFDIHTGGIDHIPVHHNNEIAQSECANDADFVNYWMHCAFLVISGGKMAKSLGNFVTLDTLKDHGISPLVYRYYLLTARYSTQLNFSYEALADAKRAYNNLIDSIVKISKTTESSINAHGNNKGTTDNTDFSEKFNEYEHNFRQFINDDLDTPKAIALVWNLLKDADVNTEEKIKLIEKFDKVFALDIIKSAILKNEENSNIPEEIIKLIGERNIARLNKDWNQSDSIREKIKELGYLVEDSSDGHSSKISKI